VIWNWFEEKYYKDVRGRERQRRRERGRERGRKGGRVREGEGERERGSNH
jgi:hypothetical protein